MKFICPKCKGSLTVAPDGRAVCEAGHSYDRSREGYYNLLLSNVGGVHGDNREMMLARRAFLDTGAYLPLARRVADAVADRFLEGGALLDVGCGEGYYTNIIESRLSKLYSSFEVVGFDISKDAVKMAAKSNKRLSLAVASAYSVPVSDGSFDVVTNLFSPLAREEIHRILRTGGSFVMAIPAENHLFGLKSAIYKTPYKNTVEDSTLEGFTLVSSERISYNITLKSKDEIRSLFMMTPYAYRTGREERERLLSLDTLETQVEFILFVYEKNKVEN